MSLSHRLLVFLTLWGSLALAAGCAASKDAPGRRNQVSSLVRYGRYQEARDLAQQLYERNPESPDARRDWIDAEVALLLDKGIDQVFLDRVEGGLRYFYRALELAPNNQEVQLWIRKANVQIAEDSLTLAASITEQQEPAAKVEALQRVLSHLPEESDSERIQTLRAKAIRGLISVQMFQDYELGGTYSSYQEGLRDLNRSLVANGVGEELRSGIANTLEVKVSGVERRFIQASRYEEKELLLAARFGYEMVLSLEPEHPGALAGLERIRPQLSGLEAGRLAKEALLPVLEEEASEAELSSLENPMQASEPPVAELEGVAQEQAPSEEQGEPLDSLGPAVQEDITPEVEDVVEVAEVVEPAEVPAVDPGESLGEEQPSPVEVELPLQTKEDKLAELYREAISLEDQGLLPAAVEVYDQIMRLQLDYKDVYERRETMAEFIVHAENLYTTAMDSDENASALILLRRIAVFWPNYRDVQEQIRIRETIEAAKDEKIEDPS